ncbi:hypothetical protein [Pedobacter sp. NJ-S-72]
MKLTIWGAAKQVTGSMHLLQTHDYSILIDCGLDYEKKKLIRKKINISHLTRPLSMSLF